MSGEEEDGADKSFEPTPEKLRKARERGDIARSTDLSVAASYAGFLLAASVLGAASIGDLGTSLMVLLDRPERLAPLFFDGSARAPVGGLLAATAGAIAPWFLLPALAVLVAILAQRGLVFAPTKIAPKASRLSIVSNAKNKFGRSGLFEFFKSFVKLLLYAGCLGLYLNMRAPEILASAGTDSRIAVAMLGAFCVEFLLPVLAIAACIGGIDAVWQHLEHRRKNRMTRKEITDETRDAEGDPHMKQQRRQRGQEIASGQMIAAVPQADVVIVNPTHYAVALKWSREPGSAPECVAKGVDEIAAAIRGAAAESGVPIHHDPPTARALHATTELGEEIPETLYAAVAAAIRFAETMRQKAKSRI